MTSKRISPRRSVRICADSVPMQVLLCGAGNNEMETQYETLAWQKSKKQTYDYIHLYEYIIPKIVKEEDPEKFYWPSSRLQAEITKTAMQRTSAIPITGVYGTEASRSPLIVPTITVSCPSSDSSPSSTADCKTVYRRRRPQHLLPCRGNAPEKYGCQRKRS